MMHVLRLMLAVLAFSVPAKANEDAIQSVISDQIEAFQVDDFDKAFTYASPLIQGIFGTADNFGTMVRQGYPMVWRPSDVEFLNSEVIDGELWQNVMVRDASGQSFRIGYQMIDSENGWKINAVRVEKADEGLV